ncbi:MAG: DUF4832 domain-containing protein [Fimbriimonadaceae bacterium]|jgi:hypothetical protein|nr:DUF4832 domain-containing protein [Fimbriimonadaceae bacterium]
MVAPLLVATLLGQSISGSGIALPGIAPLDNPLKGLVPYEGQGMSNGRILFPHSLEFDYFSLNQVLIGEKKLDWGVLDRMLDRVAKRGNQAIFRFTLEYPGKTTGIPNHWIRAGVGTTTWRSGDSQGSESITPDYSHEILRKEVTWFIAQLGARYDGDPRIGFITAGLLGSWGEWHTWPKQELFASKEVQEEIMAAYRAAFQKTPILFRYPAGPEDATYAANVNRGFGFHDDSFAYATLDTGPDWHFLAKLRKAGALEAWRTAPIGGEIRPEVWGAIFDEKLPLDAQPFDECVRETKVTWLMDSGMFDGKASQARIRRASDSVRKLGYEFRVTRWTIGSGRVSLQVENRGVAPFYHPWKIELALIDAKGEVRQVLPLAVSLQKIQPGRETRLTCDHPPVTVEAGSYSLAIRGNNPMPGGKPVGFANLGVGAPTLRWSALGKVFVSR